MKQTLLWVFVASSSAVAIAGNDDISSNEVSQERDDFPKYIQREGHFEMSSEIDGEPFGLMHINDPSCHNGCLLAPASSSNVPGVSFYLDGGALMAHAENFNMKAAVHPDDRSIEFFQEETASMDSKLLLVTGTKKEKGLLLFTTTDTFEWGSGLFLQEVRKQIKWYTFPVAQFRKDFKDDVQIVYGRRYPDYANTNALTAVKK